MSPNTRAPYAGIIFSTLLALGLIIYVSERAESDVVINLASVTSLLLLGVFTIVNIACLVLRRDGRESRFRSPGLTPGSPRLATAFLIGPWVDRHGIVYQIAGVLLLIGVGALGDHLAHQPRRPRQEDRVPRHRPPGRSDRRGRENDAGRGPPRPYPWRVSSTVPDLEALRALGPAQQPVYPDRAAVEAAVARLRTMPPLVFAGECDELKDKIAAVVSR